MKAGMWKRRWPIKHFNLYIKSKLTS
jgi:hypothetical protein